MAHPQSLAVATWLMLVRSHSSWGGGPERLASSYPVDGRGKSFWHLFRDASPDWPDVRGRGALGRWLLKIVAGSASASVAGGDRWHRSGR